MRMATALVQTAPGNMEFQEIPLPDLSPGSLLVRVEANGLCHTDVDQFDASDSFTADDPHRFPRILGHEIVGVIESMGDPTPFREGLAIGDRVAINPFNGCESCPACRRGDRMDCSGWPTFNNVYGAIPTTYGPGLWGGYSTHVYVEPLGIVYPFPARVSALDASLWNLLAGGIQWGVMNSGLQLGAKVAVLGCGQRGLAVIAAVKAAGAGVIMTSGLARDRLKLDLARDFGADLAVDIEHESLLDAAHGLVGHAGFDVVIDTSPVSYQPILDAIDLLRPGGTLVTVGLKTQPVPDFPIDRVTLKNITIVGSKGQTPDAYSRAAALIISDEIPLGRMRTHVFGFDQLERAISVLRGDDPTQSAINIVITPTFSATDGAEAPQPRV